MMEKLWKQVRSQGTLPTLRNMLNYAFKWVGNKANQISTRFRRQYYRYKYEHTEKKSSLIYISPDNVDYYLVGGHSDNLPCEYRNYQSPASRHKLEKAKYPHEECAGLILSGDWDKHKKPYLHDKTNKAIQTICSGRDLIETEYYDDLVLRKEIKSDDLDICEEVEKIHRLIESIKNNGYCPEEKGIGLKDQIGVNIGRNGEIIFNNKGHHRLAICKELNVEKIPVLVVVRHTKWQDLKERVRQARLEEDLSEEIKKYFDHPDV